VASGPPNTDDHDGEAFQSLRSSIDANDRMIADVDLLLSRRKDGAPEETGCAQPEPLVEPVPRSAS